MENPFSVLSQDDPKGEGEGNLVEFFRFHGLVPDVKIVLKDSNFHSEKYRKSCSLLTCSSKYGFFIAGSLNGFVLGQTEHLRTTIYKAERNDSTPFDELIKVPVKEGEVNIVALTCDNLQLVVGVSGGILLTYNISDIIKNKENALPVQSQKLNNEIIYIQPNPEVYPDVIAVATQNDECKLIRYMTSEIMATMSNATSMCWSPKGKQIICGTRDGKIIAYDIQGNQKDEILPPYSQNSTDIYVNAVVWIENHIFLALYSKSTNDENVHTPFIINRKCELESEKYTLLGEVNPIFNFECPDSHFYTSIIRDFGPGIKTLIILANSAAGDLATIGQDENGQWSTWMLDENTPTLPLSEDDFADTYPIGLTIDFSASEPLPPFDPSESETPVPPMPVVFFMTNEGRICSFHAYNSDLAESGKKYTGMITAQDVNQIPEPATFPQIPEATATVVASGFSTPTTPSFGMAPSKIPSFSSLGTSTSKISKPSASTPTFGSVPSSTPTFGSTSSVGFGSSGFGSFGGASGAKQTVSFASLAKSNSTNTSTPGSASSFGFGASTFGQTSSFGSKPLFGSPSTETPSFGRTSFGQPISTEPKPFTSETKPTFGQTSLSSTQPFGNTSFKPSTLDSEKKPVIEEPPDESSSDDKATDTKTKFGLSPSATQTLDIEKKEGRSLSFKKVQIDIDESKSNNTKDTDDKKLKNGFEFSLESVSNALSGTVESNENNNTYFDNTSIEEDITDEDELSEEEYEDYEEEKRVEEEKLAAEDSKVEEERKAAEEKRVAEERKIAEEKRIFEEKRIAEEKRITEERERRMVEEKRLEEERIAKVQRLEEERLAAIKPDPIFAIRERSKLLTPKPYERIPGISGIAKEFESVYFNTTEDLESTSIQLMNIDEEIYFYTKSSYTLKDISCLEDLEHVWCMSDMVDTSAMMDTINADVEKVEIDLRLLLDDVSMLVESTDNLKLDDVRSCLEAEDKDSEPLKSIKNSLEDDFKKQLNELETKSTNSKENLIGLEKKLDDCKQSLKAAKSAQYDQSKLTLYSLRRTMRDIERSLSKVNNRVSSLEQEELELRLKKEQSLNESSDDTASHLPKYLVQRGTFLNQMFLGSQKFQPLNA